MSSITEVLFEESINAKKRIIEIFSKMFETPHTENIDDLIIYWNELANLNSIKDQESDLLDELEEVSKYYSNLINQLFTETMISSTINYSATDLNDIQNLKQTQLSNITIDNVKAKHLAIIIQTKITNITNELINNAMVK